MAFVNLPLRYIDERPEYLELFLSRRLNPELGFDAQALDAYSPGRHAEIARIFHDSGLACAVHLPFFDLHPGSIDPLIRSATRERLLGALDAARVYKPAHFVAHLGYSDLTYANFQDQWLKNSLETWNLILDHACAPLFLENVFELAPDRLLRVLDGLRGRARACLDLGHWHCFARGWERGGMNDWLEALSPHLGHLHLHDNNGAADQHLGLGQGSIPWDGLWDFLEKRKAPVTVTFEPHTKDDFLATEAYLRDNPGRCPGQKVEPSWTGQTPL
jgi:sugar phosphate isomerase/epimerase